MSSSVAFITKPEAAATLNFIAKSVHLSRTVSIQEQHLFPILIRNKPDELYTMVLDDHVRWPASPAGTEVFF